MNVCDAAECQHSAINGEQLDLLIVESIFSRDVVEKQLLEHHLPLQALKCMNGTKRTHILIRRLSRVSERVSTNERTR